MVALHVTVPRQKLVRGSPHAFAIYEDGVRQQVQFFDSQACRST